MRTTLFLFVALVIAVTGCEQKGEQSALEMRNDELVKELVSREKFIDDVSATINEIHGKLENVWAMEKNIVGQTAMTEGNTAVNQTEVKQRILDRISDIQTTLEENRKKVTALQRKLKESSNKFAGLEKIVESMETTLGEREKSIADLQMRVQNLEGEVVQKTQMIAVHEATIDDQTEQIKEQTKQINTAYYAVGNSDELKEKGLITNEGGILWGLMGTTTVLASNFDENGFQPLDKTTATEIEVPGTIDEIIPKRDERYYVTVETGDERTILQIINPAFWNERHLVIVMN